MINNSKVRNVQVNYPIIEGLLNPETLGKIRLKNLYPQWNGESVNIIKDKHKKNPYTVRIGTPKTDSDFRDDRIYFISHYLSYNPITQDLENRDIISRRIMDKLYVGQTTLEGNYPQCKAFVNGSMVLSDIYLTKSEKLKDTSLTRVVLNLMDRVDQLTKEVAKLKVKPKQNTIYTKDSILDE
tara:strand:- start:126 stop:674 length:549 start_codon:yes stop_codon:yes gene_type:complete